MDCKSKQNCDFTLVRWRSTLLNQSDVIQELCVCKSSMDFLGNQDSGLECSSVLELLPDTQLCSVLKTAQIKINKQVNAEILFQ